MSFSPISAGVRISSRVWGPRKIVETPEMAFASSADSESFRKSFLNFLCSIHGIFPTERHKAALPMVLLTDYEK